MMLRRGTGGYYVNGLVARYPRAGVSLRDAETYARAGSVATPDMNTTDLALKNIVFTEDGAVFQPTGSTVQNSFDMAGNALVASTTPTASMFTAFPATITASTPVTAFDWTPPTTSPIATGGLQTFTGKLATAAGTTVVGTAYQGAAQPGGTKWWQGWTVYTRN